MAASVNSLFPDLNSEHFSVIPKGNLCEIGLKNVRTSIGKITANESAILHYIYHLSSNNKGREFYCSRETLASKARCHVDTVTRVLRKLANGGLLMLRYERQGLKKILFIDVNWLENCIVLGGRIFASATRRTLEFLKQKTADFFKILYPAKCRIEKSSTEEEKTIYSVAIAPSYIAKSHKMYNNFNTEGKSENLPSMHTDTEPLRVVTGELLAPISPMLMRNPPNNDTAYDESITECPDVYRDKALRRFIRADKIDDMFQDFRYYKIKNKRSKKSKHSDWLRAWDNWVMNALKFNKDEFFDQERYHTQLQANGSKFQLPTSKQTSVPYVHTMSAPIEDRMHWNKELTNEGFWKVSGSPDYSQFTAFYTGTGKGADIMDSKNGWLLRWAKWHERSAVAHKSPAVKAYGETKALDIKIPDEYQDIHKRLVKRMEEQNYVSWVQSPKVIIKKHPSPTDQYLYVADYTGIGNAFAKKTVSERYRSDFEDLKIEII